MRISFWLFALAHLFKRMFLLAFATFALYLPTFWAKARRSKTLRPGDPKIHSTLFENMDRQTFV
jgi:hypothetical protein